MLITTELIERQYISIQSTEDTPKVELDGIGRKYSITGKLGSIDPESFWNPLILWAKKFASQKRKPSVFEFSFNCINSASVSYLLKFIKVVLSQPSLNDKNISFRWYIDRHDSDMEDIVTDVNDILGNKIEIIFT